jgi:DNA repair exonuclease SbcCD ATPase subunit
MLRRRVKEMESASEEIDRLKQDVQEKTSNAEKHQAVAHSLSKDAEGLKRELDELRACGSQELKQQLERVQSDMSATIRTLESRLRESDRTIVSLRAASSMARSATMDELELENLRSEVVSLQRNLQHQTSAVETAKATIRELEQMLAERNSNDAAAREDEKEELLTEIETLTSQLEEARSELKMVEEQRCIIDDFKTKLEAADEARETSEKNIVDVYERKLSLLNLDKDVTIDKLRKELADTKERCDEELGSRGSELDRLRAQVEALREQMANEIQEREAHIFALERTLEAQEQLVNNMRSEMDTLQGSMENKAVTRREELELMQQELVDLTTLAAQQERDLRSLQGKLLDERAEHDAQVSKLKETIAIMEREEEGDHRTAADLKMEIRVREAKDRLEKLKWRNTSLSEENELLRERLVRSEEKGAREMELEGQNKELQRVLAERMLRLQIAEAELSELRRDKAQQTVAPPPPPPPATTSDPSPQEPPSPKTTALCKSPMRSPSSSSSPGGSAGGGSSGKPPASSRRLGFLGRRASSARRAAQS